MSANVVFMAAVRQKTGYLVVSEHAFHPKRKWRFDYAIPECMVAIEVEGGVWTRGRHTRPKGFLGDIEKYNEATAMGWRIFRCTPQTLLSTKFIKLVEKLCENR